MGEIVRWSIIVIGAVLFVLNLFSLARRRMTPTLSVIWSIFSLFLLVLGSILHLTELGSLMSPTTAVLLILALCGVIFTFYHVSTQISELVDKTNELTMQVSLLNAENVRLLRQVKQEKLAEEEASEEPV